MPRDASRNLYITIGIPRDSRMYQRLAEEATETGLALSQVIAIRLADYYHVGPDLRSPTSLPSEQRAEVEDDAPVLAHETRDLEARAAQAAAAWAADEE
ncbi:MAG: hypothetical protein WCD86_02135 [Ktedonobacteraceae bacterium]